MKRLLLIYTMAIMVCTTYGAPAKPVICRLAQPDGSTIEARLVGNELSHHYETLDGDILEKNENGYYATIDENRNRKMIVGPKAQARKAFGRDRSVNIAKKGLVVLVDFADIKFTKSREEFVDLLNKDGYDINGAIGSAMNYFKDASNGKYIPQFDIYGPYTLDKTMSYYGENTSSGEDRHPDQMVVDAIHKLKADTSVNVNLADYDSDNDGYVDHIFIYYAGYGEEAGANENTIWAHAWEIVRDFVLGKIVFDNVTLKTYACAAELQSTQGDTIASIGLFCHEFSHVLGLPDFYITDYSSDRKTLGQWDIMDAGCYLNNGNTPPTYSAHERFFMGWLTPEILNSAGNMSLNELQKSNKAYIVTETGTHNLNGYNPIPETYFLLENRQQIGWDAYLPGHGLMITKTVFDNATWKNNIPNNDVDNMGYDLIEADGDTTISEGKPSDLFPGSKYVVEYTPFAQYPIFNITESAGVISFDFINRNGGYDIKENVVLTKNANKYSLSGLPYGAEVYCIDATGRIVWQKNDVSNVVFDSPNAVFFIHIIYGEQRHTVRGI